MPYNCLSRNLEVHESMAYCVLKTTTIGIPHNDFEITYKDDALERATHVTMVCHGKDASFDITCDLSEARAISSV